MLKNLMFVGLIGLTGCAVRGTAGVAYTEPAPSLVYVSPGVSVIEDYDQPVFYSDNYYWRYDSGNWYRSRNYRGGWQVDARVPVAVRRIERPHAYVHYRGNVVRRGPTVRNHRR